VFFPLARALTIRGFTLQVYSRWLSDYSSPRESHAYDNNPFSICHRRIQHVEILKRWLRPENEELLISLLRERKLRLPDPLSSYRNKPGATILDVAQFFSDPQVTINWPLEILEYHNVDEFLRCSSEFVAYACKELLCSAFKKPNINADTLNTLFFDHRFKTADFTWTKISQAAFESENPVVITWASDRGFVPSGHQLKRLFSHMNNEASLRLLA
jgi:hypothetical protein